MIGNPDSIDAPAQERPTDEERWAACASLSRCLSDHIRILAGRDFFIRGEPWVLVVPADVPIPPGFAELYPAGRTLPDGRGWAVELSCYHTDNDPWLEAAPGIAHRGIAFGVKVFGEDEGRISVRVVDPVRGEAWDVLDVIGAPSVGLKLGGSRTREDDDILRELDPHMLPPVYRLLGRAEPPAYLNELDDLALIEARLHRAAKVKAKAPRHPFVAAVGGVLRRFVPVDDGPCPRVWEARGVRWRERDAAGFLPEVLEFPEGARITRSVILRDFFESKVEEYFRHDRNSGPPLRLGRYRSLPKPEPEPLEEDDRIPF